MKSFLLLAFLALVPVVAHGASPALSLSPQTGGFSVGETFLVDVLVNTQGQDVNALAAYINYPVDLLSVAALDVTGSPLEFIVEQNYGLGRVEISGGTPTPGFNGTYRIATIEFHAIAAGGATLSFTGDSAVLLDSDNTNILQNPPTATISIMDTNAGTAPLTQQETPQYRSPLETLLAFLKGLL